MPTSSRSEPDAREVDRVEGLMTADGSPDDFLKLCIPGSTWLAKIRTAEVTATIKVRRPLGTFDEHVCTCVSLKLALPVPVEPGLRFQIVAENDPHVSASGVVRPWGG